MADDPVIVRRMREFLAKHSPPGRIVVAVSGGPDSVALLRAACAVGVGPLTVAHLNHGLRGADSDTDADFVANLANRLVEDGHPIAAVRVTRRDVMAEAAGENLEAAARRIRYAWLAEVARELDAAWVATGHTADDQAETVLFQILRGTGLDGLAGIAARRPLNTGVELVRPILKATREDVLTYLQSLGQLFRQDATNADQSRSRSRIRHDLLPHLKRTYNPQIVPALARLAEQAAELQRDRRVQNEKRLRRVERPRAGALLVFDQSALAKIPRRRRREVWRMVWRREGWPRQEMGFREWDRLAALCRGGPPALDLPGGIRARRRGYVVQVGPANSEV